MVHPSMAGYDVLPSMRAAFAWPLPPGSTPKIGFSHQLLPDDPHGVIRCFDPAAFLFWRHVAILL
ncbi:MAG: hypothetical protein B7Z67_07085 [Acidiphilium sp. 21-60-14]|nr:MAG: hypothetical protein B7Z67_07085 [Acidiphilium sp. 21-60-14]OYV91605.1 MAG: hypothetical protein B7Z57_03950 [Acidiphilium sp. 37-60-79]OZB40691.1 MAG: hypothetical protein B7X48_03880 [Acidiphilium sp. 34-60-192]